MKIFVSVGTQKFPFDRLLHLADGTAKDDPELSLFIQTGTSEFHPAYCESKAFLNAEEFEKQIHDCDLLIVHSGVGTIIKGLNGRKKIIVVPRLAKYGEHVDDHQLQIAEAFAEKNFVICYQDGENLRQLIREAAEHEFDVYTSHREDMIAAINSYLRTI